MIISASRRTDIPAFHGRWFMNSIREGFCLVANPFNPAQVSKVSLAPADVETIVFWTRNPEPLMPHLAELDSLGYSYYFQYTLLDYPKELHPHARSLDETITTFQNLSGAIGPKRVIWRYDPIIISNVTNAEFHIRRVEQIAARLEGCTQRLVISILDVYRGIQKRLEALVSKGLCVEPAPSRDTILEMAAGIVRAASARGMEVQSCAEEPDLTEAGVKPGKCIDDKLIRDLIGHPVSARKDPTQRKACHCVVSKDIGMYGTCPAGCVYCYAARAPGA